jgi:hypothetical protein
MIRFVRHPVLLLAVLLCWGAARAPAQDAPLERRAQDAFAQEFAECAAFYLVVAEAYRRIEESAQARVYTSLANVMLDRAVQAGEEAKVMLGAKQALREMFERIGNDIERMGVLNAQYVESCALGYDYPERVMEKWRAKLAE